MNEIETEPQMKDSLKKLDAFLDSSTTQEINKDLIVHTNFYTRKFQANATSSYVTCSLL